MKRDRLSGLIYWRPATCSRFSGACHRAFGTRQPAALPKHRDHLGLRQMPQSLAESLNK